MNFKLSRSISTLFFALGILFTLVQIAPARAQSEAQPPDQLVVTTTKEADTATNTKIVNNSKNAPIFDGLAIVQKYLGFTAADPRSIAAKLIKVALGFVAPLFFLVVLYSGFLWMISGGDDEKVDKAKKTFYSAIIGVIIILSAYSIVLYVMRTLGVS